MTKSKLGKDELAIYEAAEKLLEYGPKARENAERVPEPKVYEKRVRGYCALCLRSPIGPGSFSKDRFTCKSCAQLGYYPRKFHLGRGTLQRWRKRAGLPLKELARLMGVTPPRVVNMSLQDRISGRFVDRLFVIFDFWGKTHDVKFLYKEWPAFGAYEAKGIGPFTMRKMEPTQDDLDMLESDKVIGDGELLDEVLEKELVVQRDKEFDEWISTL
jgi:transcriptional regulator with XRE-family HTH domain